MKEFNEIGKDEMLEWAKMNGISMSEGQAKDLVNDENSDIDLDEWFKENDINPIGEYENLSKKMKSKIKEIMESLKDEKKKELEKELDDKEKSDDRDEKDNLDEKDGKEELDEDKKKEVEEKEREKEGQEESEEGKEDKDKEETEKEKESDEKEDKNEVEIPKKDEYLANVKKLHEMKIRDYKDQMKKDDPKMDKYFVAMIYLQRDINRQRQAFIKEYGVDELRAIENDYLKEELKYEKTLNVRMDKDLTKLRQLDNKLDAVMDKMESLQKGLEDKTISLEEYNDEINSLEKEKLDTLWQINRLNPELLEEKQENIKERDMYERKVSPQNIQKRKDMSEENREKLAKIEHSEKMQDGMADKMNDDMKDMIQEDIDEKEKRLDELRKELKGIDIESTEGKKRALEVIGEIQTLESQKASQEKQQENLEKNMGANVQSYGDLQESEVERRDDTKEFEEARKDINPETVSNDLMAELKNAAMDDPETPEQAEKYLDSINEATEDVAESKDKEEQQQEDNAPTLFNRRKRPY